MDEITKKQQLSDSLKLMAAFFYEPEPELFEEERVFQNLSSLFEEVCPEACSLTWNMRQAMQGNSNEELQVAHAELFIGPFELKASPYGSTYIDNARQIMGESTMKVKKHYQKAGLEVDIQQPPDHIAIELEFLSHLCALEAEALHGGDLKNATALRAEQKFFLGTYVLPWMPDFVEKIRAGTENNFYLSLADCFEKFLGYVQFGDLGRMTAHADATTH